MKQQTKEIINDITQGMINANNKYYEERKIAKQEILDAIDNSKSKYNTVWITYLGKKLIIWKIKGIVNAWDIS